MSKQPDLLDTKHEGDTNVLINRYRITTPGNDELLIRAEKSPNAGPFFGFLLLTGMGTFFAYLVWHAYVTEGFDWTLVVYSLFALFPGVGGILILLAGYVFQPAWHFKKEELVITTNLGMKKHIDKEEVISVYISKTLFSERGRSADQYSYWLALRMKNPVKYKDGRYSLFNVEGRDSISFMIGALDRKGMSKTEEQSLQLAHCIAEYWNIPVKV